jgi:8-oxo-dGTP pyrophosphatase MutT (NUDIX family)
VACIIENKQGEILLTRRAFEPSKGMLDLPGGFVNLDETAESTVHREVNEELNLDITSLQYIGSSPNHYLYGGMVYFTLDLGFKCIVTDFTNMHVADDVDGYVFLSHQLIDFRKISFPSICNILQLYFTSLRAQPHSHQVKFTTCSISAASKFSSFKNFSRIILGVTYPR